MCERKTDVLVKIAQGIEIADCRKIENTLTKYECKTCEDYDSKNDRCTRYDGFNNKILVGETG